MHASQSASQCIERNAAFADAGIEAVFGRLRSGVDFDYLLSDSVRVDVGRPGIEVATDGEVSTFAPPLNYRTHPLALRVLVPDEAPPAAN